MKTNLLILTLFLSKSFLLAQTFEEKGGVVAVEAEHFVLQSKDEVRKWYVIDESFRSDLEDNDPVHAKSASGGKYLEILPDTRSTHDDKLLHGENFSNAPGKSGVLTYKIFFNTPGKYYVWVRAYSTGTEDNGIHVGLDNEWPESGQRMQWCEGKNQWTWASQRRTQEVHCGEEKLIYLDIKTKGLHTVHFSMREDGFEFDKFVLEQEYVKPEGAGPKELEFKK